MERQSIILTLQSSHRDFLMYFTTVSDQVFERIPENKWSPGQHLEHIRRSVAAVKMALRLPRFVLRLFFGKANRPSREYEELVKKYKAKLVQGGRAGGRFIPPLVSSGEKAMICRKLETEIKTLCHQLSNWSEKDLDVNILPHPLLGKLTVREMMYFTAYHAEHHLEILKKPPYITAE